MNRIMELYGDVVVQLTGAAAVFILMGAVCAIYRNIIMSVLDGIFYK